jgi:hypothetical protein
MTLKDRLQNNKGKLLAGAGAIGAGILGHAYSGAHPELMDNLKYFGNNAKNIYDMDTGWLPKREMLKSSASSAWDLFKDSKMPSKMDDTGILKYGDSTINYKNPDFKAVLSRTGVPSLSWSHRYSGESPQTEPIAEQPSSSEIIEKKPSVALPEQKPDFALPEQKPYLRKEMQGPEEKPKDWDNRVAFAKAIENMFNPILDPHPAAPIQYADKPNKILDQLNNPDILTDPKNNRFTLRNNEDRSKILARLKLFG